MAYHPAAPARATRLVIPLDAYGRAGFATLIPTPPGPVQAWSARADLTAVRFYTPHPALTALANTTLGTIAKLPDHGYSVTAHNDYTSPQYILPDARTCPQAVRILLPWWIYLTTPTNPGEPAKMTDPALLPRQTRRELFGGR